jgi:hypothetical protein
VLHKRNEWSFYSKRISLETNGIRKKVKNFSQNSTRRWRNAGRLIAPIGRMRNQHDVACVPGRGRGHGMDRLRYEPHGDLCILLPQLSDRGFPKISFAVRFLSGARQRGSLPCVFPIAHEKKRSAKKLFVVRFSLNAWQKNSLSCVFFLGARQTFFPHRMLPLFTAVSLCVIFVMH